MLSFIYLNGDFVRWLSGYENHNFIEAEWLETLNGTTDMLSVAIGSKKQAIY